VFKIRDILFLRKEKILLDRRDCSSSRCFGGQIKAELFSSGGFLKSLVECVAFFIVAFLKDSW
jgi:hypothetical protein